MSDTKMIRIRIIDPTPTGNLPLVMINDNIASISIAQKRVLLALMCSSPHGLLTSERAVVAILGKPPEVTYPTYLWCVRSSLERIRTLIDKLSPEGYRGFVRFTPQGYQLADGVSVGITSSPLI